MSKLVFDDDAGWIAVDEVTGEYDHQLQMEIQFYTNG